MTRLEAKGAIQHACESGYSLQWDQSHSKSGKSHVRYEYYKRLTSFDEVKKAIADKKMLNEDLIYDVQRGICKLLKPQPATPKHVEIEDVDQIEAIEASIACLSEVVPMANDEIGPIERLYDLRTRMSNGKEVAQDSWRASKAGKVMVHAVAVLIKADRA